MAIELNPIADPTKIGGFNSNFKKIEEEFNENVLRRDGVSPGEANQMEVDLDMNGQSILNVKTALSDPNSLVSLRDADIRYVFVEGDTMTGNLSMGGFGVTNLRPPTQANEAARKDYVDQEAGKKLSKSGDSMSGDLSMSGNDVNSIGTTRTDSLVLGGVTVSPNALNEAGVFYSKTVEDLKAVPIAGLVDGQASKITTTGRAGDFTWMSGDQSTDVSGDPHEGIFVAPDSDATGASGAWKRVFSSTVNVLWFGAVADGIADDTNAIQAALQYAYDAAEQVGWRGDTATVYLPRGTYRVAQPNILFSGLIAGSFRIVGDGGTRRNSATQILYDVPSVVSTEYMIDNDQIFGFSVFRDITFVAANGGNFMHLVGGGPGNAQSFTFERCTWSGWTDHINVIGSTLGSEVTFWRCKLEQFDGVSFRMNNSQAVNWRFYATEIESFAGTAFEFIKGMTVLFSQGSIIPVGSNARVLKVPSEAVPSAFGGSNQPHVIFHGTRFEMRQGALMTEKVQENCSFMVKFDGCGMGGNNIPIEPIPKMFTWAGSGQITIRDCGNCKNYLFDHTVDGSSSSQDLNVIIDNSDFLPSVITDSIFAITGTTSNDGRKPLFNVTNCGEGLDGSYRPASDNQYDVTQQKHNITFSRSGTKILVEPMPGGGWPATRSLSLPPVRLTNIQFYPISYTAYGSSATATITIKSGDGTQTLASFTWNMDDPVDVVMEAAANYRVQSESGEDLLFEFSSSYTGTTPVVFSGLLYLTY